MTRQKSQFQLRFVEKRARTIYVASIESCLFNSQMQIERKTFKSYENSSIVLVDLLRKQKIN